MALIGVLDEPSGPLSFVVVCTRPLTSPFALCADGVVLAVVAAYLVGTRRHRGGDHAESDRSTGRWPRWRALAFSGGAVLLFAAVGSGLARYENRPSVLVVQHVLLMMAAPPMIIAGRPLRAWRSPRRPAPDPPRRAVRVLRTVQGVASWPLYYGAMAAFFLTPLLAASVRDPGLLALVDCSFVAVGLVFFSTFFGPGPRGRPRSYTFRIAAILVGAPLETALGLALVLWPRPLIPGTVLAATHTAGLVLWIASMAASGAVLGAVLVQWVLEDARRGAEVDLLLSSNGWGSGGVCSRP